MILINASTTKLSVKCIVCRKENNYPVVEQWSEESSHPNTREDHPKKAGPNTNSDHRHQQNSQATNTCQHCAQ